MPEIRHFKVTQTREVEVTANTQEDAIRIASTAFKNGQRNGKDVIDGPEGVWGNTSHPVKEIELSCRVKGYLG